VGELLGFGISSGEGNVLGCYGKNFFLFWNFIENYELLPYSFVFNCILPCFFGMESRYLFDVKDYSS
jgi:hypothetical protein